MRTLRTRWRTSRPFGTAIAILLVIASIGPSLASASMSATIANTDGDNVLLRSGPGYDQPELDRFPEGTMADVLSGPTTAADGSTWYTVTIEGQTGYMDGQYLTADTAFSRTSGRAVATDAVNVRSGPSAADGVVTTLASGDSVTLTGGNRLGWLSVSAAGGDGWVYGDFLAASDGDSGTGETRWTLAQVNLRSGPGTQFEAVAVLPVDVEVSLTGKIEGQFASVTTAYGDGWVYTQVIGPDAPANPVTPDVTVTPEPTEVTGTTDTRWTLEQVHLRAGPSTDSASIVYLDAGVQLELTGKISDGFAQVTSSYATGWVFAQYIGPNPPAESPTATAEPETPAPTAETPAPEPETPETPTPEPSEPVSRYTNANVNLRSEADAASTSLAVLASGTEVQFAGITANGFSQVTATAGTGWIASEYLSEALPEPPPLPQPSDSLIVWPVRGGEWNMLQGYNGSSHQNRSSTWQYLYALDLQRSDGNTAGQPVYAPVSGTIRWIDEAFGGGSIYMGNGLAFAWFHTVIDPGIEEGDTVTQGQYLGTVAPAGQFGAGSNPHLHITIWQTNDGGNWSRIAIPFTGNVAISGEEFPSNGSSNQWRGVTFYP